MKWHWKDSPAGDAHRRASIDERAAEWLARRDAGLTPEEAAEFAAWVSADPRRGVAVNQLESAWRLIRKPARSGQAEHVMVSVARRVEAQARSRRRRVAALVVMGCAAVVVVLFPVFRSGTDESLMEVEPAARVEKGPERRILDDGSVVELNAATEIAVVFSNERRGVQLIRGEALFTVSKDVTRPFVVSAGGILVRAIGTTFAVRYDPAAVGVLVTEGRVAVDRVDSIAAPSGNPRPIGRGQAETCNKAAWEAGRDVRHEATNPP